MKRIFVEMVIPQLAEKGGLDRIINEYARFLSEKDDMELRIVQLVDTGLQWWEDDCPIISLCDTADNPSYMDTAEVYASYLESVSRKPDVVIATGWPITITIVRQALRISELQVPLVAYPHMTFQEASEHGVGDISCLNDADEVFVISKQIETEIEEANFPIKRVRINNGIEFPEDVPNRDLTEKKRLLLYVGRLVDYKNIEMIFRALAQTKEPWGMLVVGQGELEKAKMDAARYQVEERVNFCGFRTNPYDDMENVAFCVVSSNYEGFCLVIPEALSRGIPVISTPVGCATEVIRPGENGYLVPVNDDAMLARVLNMVSDGTLPIPDARTCRESVKDYDQKHAFEVMYGALLDAFER